MVGNIGLKLRNTMFQINFCLGRLHLDHLCLTGYLKQQLSLSRRKLYHQKKNQTGSSCCSTLVHCLCTPCLYSKKRLFDGFVFVIGQCQCPNYFKTLNTYCQILFALLTATLRLTLNFGMCNPALLLEILRIFL